MIGFYTLGICSKCHRTKIIFTFKDISEPSRRLKLLKAGWKLIAEREFCPRCGRMITERAAMEAVIRKIDESLKNAKIKRR